jgi:hypothetical protein
MISKSFKLIERGNIKGGSLEPPFLFKLKKGLDSLA